MRSEPVGRLIFAISIIVTAGLLGGGGMPYAVAGGEGSLVTGGRQNADVIGDDNRAIQKAIERVAAAGGGTVLIKAGTYTLSDSVRLTSHLKLRGEGAHVTILKRTPTVTSKLTQDADTTESQVTVEDARGFAPGMGVVIRDEVKGWHDSTEHTIVRIVGNILYLDGLLTKDYEVDHAALAFNSFSPLRGINVSDVLIEDLTADGNDPRSPGAEEGAMYFYHAQQLTIRNCVIRNDPDDGISAQYVQQPVIEHCEAYGNARIGIHLGTGAFDGVVSDNRIHDNGSDGLFLCYRVQRCRWEANQCYHNGGFGISLGHEDTDNTFVNNVVRDNDHAGIYFRSLPNRSAANRNVFRDNQILDNGAAQAGAYGGGIRIDGETTDLTFVSNTIRDERGGESGTPRVAIRIGAQADRVTCDGNVIEGYGKQPIVDESHSNHNHLQAAAVN